MERNGAVSDDNHNQDMCLSLILPHNDQTQHDLAQLMHKPPHHHRVRSIFHHLIILITYISSKRIALGSDSISRYLTTRNLTLTKGSNTISHIKGLRAIYATRNYRTLRRWIHSTGTLGKRRKADHTLTERDWDLGLESNKSVE